MKKIAVVSLLVLAIPAFGCAMQQKKVEKSLKDPAPVNCETAEGDIRVLESEKAHVAERIMAGVTSVVPASAALGILTWTAPTKIRVASGKYNEMIEERIAQIQSECGL
jgi:hypothetical protein